MRCVFRCVFLFGLFRDGVPNVPYELDPLIDRKFERVDGCNLHGPARIHHRAIGL